MPRPKAGEVLIKTKGEIFDQLSNTLWFLVYGNLCGFCFVFGVSMYVFFGCSLWGLSLWSSCH
jgi:hypothetical protein